MRPPRVARWLFGVTLPRGERDDVLANLDDLYRFRRTTRGRWDAWWWYWRQTLSFPARLRFSSTGFRADTGEARFSPRREFIMPLLADVRYAFRTFSKSPAYLFAAVGTLALGFGANAVIYAVVNAAVLRPLPFPDADRLVWVWPSGEIALTHKQFTELQPEVEDHAEMSAWAFRGYAVTGGQTPEVVTGAGVSTNHFDVIGTPPLLGRAFRLEDGVPGGESVAVISYELWQSHFAGDSAVVGTRVDLFTSASIPMVDGAFTGAAYTVIGVMPPRYRPFGFQAQVYTPLLVDQGNPNFSNMGELTVVGRLRAASADQLRRELTRLSTRIPSLQGAQEAIARDRVLPLHDALFGHLRPVMFVALGAVGVVLLIACANVANLALARSQSRQRELAMRYALGAGRGRLARQLLTESLVLSSIAAASGLIGARLALPAVVRALPAEIVGGDGVSLDWSVVLFLVGVLIVTSMLAGVAPAIRSTKGLHGRLTGSPGGGRSRRGHHINHALVIGEIGLALVLAYGAGLLLKSFDKLTRVDPGFAVENVLTVRTAPSEEQYGDPAVRRALYARILETIRAIPGVASAGAIHFLPIADGGPSIYFAMDPADPESRRAAGYRVVTPGYMETMGIPVLQGRTINADDAAGSMLAGVINRSLAAQLWPGGNALGQTVYRTNGQAFFTVVGIVGDVRQAAVGLPPRPEIYLPLAQSGWASAMTVVVRTAGPQPGLPAQLRSIIRAVDANLPITHLASMETVISDSLATPRFYGILFSVFALLALVLGGIGVYGVASFVTSSRVDEIGIRLALGATRGGILVRELGRGALLAGSGMALGVLAASVAARVLANQLYDMSAFDPAIFAAAGLVLASVALLGVLLPARRASRVDPMATIRAAN